MGEEPHIPGSPFHFPLLEVRGMGLDEDPRSAGCLRGAQHGQQTQRVLLAEKGACAVLVGDVGGKRVKEEVRGCEEGPVGV